MEAHLLDWLNLLGRWAHMITGIAWIGSSFYFVWLDNHLQSPRLSVDSEKGVSGELWSVHGGGFYHAQKYQVSPAELPTTLHWFKWEAYTTWISGMFLLILLYWYQADIYLIDASVLPIGKPLAVGLGLASLVIGWFAYDRLCHSRLGSNERLLAVVVSLSLIVVAWLLCRIFSGRGAYMHFGAMLGTIMVANVFFVIIPGQRDLVAAKEQGRQPDPIHGIRGKQRSVHNTYFTLPVLFVMISNHFPITWSHRWNWLILVAIGVAGALIRLYFVLRHKRKAPLWPLLLAGAIFAALIYATRPVPAVSDVNSGSAVTDDIALGIIQQRCSSCHARQPSQPGFAVAPKGIVLESLADIVDQADSIYLQSVQTRAMPIANLTGMLEEERELLGSWIQTRGQQSKDGN